MSQQLKIGIICYPLIGGSGILASSLATQLANRGHEVHIFSYDSPIRIDLDSTGIHFHRVSVNNYRPFKYAEYTLPLAIKIAEISAKEKLDIIHAHYAVPHATASCIAREMIGSDRPKIVTTLHGTDTTLLGQNPNYKFAIQHALNQSDVITTVSESLKQDTLQTFEIEKEIRVIYNFFSPSSPTSTREKMRESLGIGQRFMLLHMSNLRPVKRIDLLLQAIALCEEKENLRLVILAGDDFDSYRQKVEDLGIGNYVQVETNATMVEDYLQAADAGVYTSEKESFCLSILETMFFAKPPIAFSVGGIPEVTGNEQCGLLHPFGDVEAMAKSIDSLVASPSKADELGANAQARARSHFTAEIIVPQYLDTYYSAL